MLTVNIHKGFDVLNSRFVLAPAQCGLHAATKGEAPKHPRRTYGHSLVIAPWGEILADGGEELVEPAGQFSCFIAALNH